MSRTCVAMLCALSVAQTGCWTSASTGEELRQQGAERDRRLERLEASMRATGEQLDAKIAQLEEVLQRATALLARNSADSGAKLEEAQQQLAALQGQLAELNNDHDTLARSFALRSSDLEQRIDRLTRRAAEPEQVAIPADKGAHLATARGAFAANDFEKARTLFREFVTRYAQDAEAAKAQFSVGESYRLEGQHARALGEYRKVISEFGASDSVNDALFSMALSFYELHACTDAGAALEALSRRRPSAAVARRIKEKQDQIKQAPAEHCAPQQP